MIIITRHAEKRIRKRLGVPRSAVEKIAEDAYENGTKHGKIAGRVKRYVDKLYFGGKCNNIRIHNRYVFLFQGESLITVFQMPRGLKVNI